MKRAGSGATLVSAGSRRIIVVITLAATAFGAVACGPSSPAAHPKKPHHSVSTNGGGY